MLRVKSFFWGLFALLFSAPSLAQTCQARPPIIAPTGGGASQYCVMLLPTLCAATADAAAQLLLTTRRDLVPDGTTNGPIACDTHFQSCGCKTTPQVIDGHTVFSCPFTVLPNNCSVGGGTCSSGNFGVGVELVSAPSCPNGYTLVGNQCHADDMIEQDAAAEAAGGKINRDSQGNILSIEQPVGKVVTSMANYDQFGRPGLINATLVQWPADGSALLSGLSLGSTSIGVKLSDPATLIEVDNPNSNIYKFAYWPNDNVSLFEHDIRTSIIKRFYTQTGDFSNVTVTVLPPPVHVSAAISTFGAATALPAPTTPAGVHTISIKPPASATPILAIGVTAGAISLYPFAKPYVDTMMQFLHRCMATQTRKECEDAAWNAYNADIHRCDDTFPMKGVEWSQCYRSAIDKYNAAIELCKSTGG